MLNGRLVRLSVNRWQLQSVDLARLLDLRIILYADVLCALTSIHNIYYLVCAGFVAAILIFLIFLFFLVLLSNLDEVASGLMLHLSHSRWASF